MATELEALLIEIRARDAEFLAALGRVEARLTQFGQKVEASTKKATKGFEEMGKAVSKVQNQLKNFAVGFLSVQTVAQFIKIADEVGNLRAQIDNLTTSTEQSAEVFARLQASAKQMGVPLANAVDLFQRLSFGTKGLGASNADLLKVTETLQKIGVVGKVSVENLNSALTQLGQIFTQGKFQADELNIILAQAPQIVQAIADGMGITVNELLRLRAAGKLTVEDTFKALLKVSDEVNEKFQSIPPTVARASAAAAVTIGQAIDELNRKLGITQTLAEGIVDLTGRLSQAFNLETPLEKLGRLQKQLTELQQAAATQAGGGLAGLGATFVRGPAAEIQRNIAAVIAEMDALKAKISESDAALAQSGEVIKSQYTPEQIKAAEAVRKHNERLKEHAETLNLSGAALAEYHKQAVLKETGDKALAQTTYEIVLADEAAKKKKEELTKATQKAAEAERKAAQLRKQTLQDIRDAELLVNKLTKDKFDLDKKDAEANAASLRQLRNELAATQEEGRLIAASLAPKEELRRIELEITQARIEREAATKLVTAAENMLTEEEKATIAQTKQVALANAQAAASYAAMQQAIDEAALSTADLKTFTQGILSGTQDVGQTLGVRLVEGVLFGKGQKEKAILGNFNQLLGVDAAGLFGQQGANLGNTLISSLSSTLQSVGIDLGSLFGQSFGTTAGQTASSQFSNVIAGGSSTAASAGTAFGTAFGSFAAGAAGMALGKGLSSIFGGSGTGSTIGGGIGAVGGGIVGSFFGAPQLGAFIGGIGGSLLGGIIGSLFAHTPTRGTQIRKGVKDFLKEIEVSFADEIDSGDYFFEETKKLAEKMFGGSDGKDFLKASKVILEDKIGPELSRQLQSLGAFITADSADKLGKSVEQTGTTFGNLLLDNLGLNPKEIESAVQEIVQKAGISFESLTDKLTDLFQDNEIGVEFYKDTIQGAVDLFFGELPDAINVSAIALKSFTEKGVFDLEQFDAKLKEVTTTFDIIVASFVDAVKNSEPGVDIGEELGKQIIRGLEEAAIDAYLTDFVAHKLFEGIDLSDGLGAEELELLKQRAEAARVAVDALADAFGGAGREVDETGEKVDDLFEKIKKLTQERFDLRLDVLGDLEAVGAISGIEQAQARIAAQRATLEGLGAATRTDFSDLDLEQGLEAIQQMRRATVDLFRAQEQTAQEALRQQIQNINAEYDARRAALQDEAQAAQEASQERIEALGRERDAVQELFETRLDALQEELQIAQEFRQVAESLQQTINSLVQSASPFSRPEQLAIFRSQAAELRGQIAGASREDQPQLIQELSQLLANQLNIGREFLDPTAFNQLFTEIVGELEGLRDQTESEGDRTEVLQQEIASTTAQMEVQLRSIDLSIQQAQDDAQAAARELQLAEEELSQQEQAAIKAAEAATTAELAGLRQQAVQEIQNLGLIEDAILAEQIRRGMEDADFNAEQLSILGSINAGIGNLETTLGEFLNTALTQQTTTAQSADSIPGFVQTATGGGSVNVSVAVPISTIGSGDNPKAIEEYVIQLVADQIRRDGKIRRAIQEVW